MEPSASLNVNVEKLNDMIGPRTQECMKSIMIIHECLRIEYMVGPRTCIHPYYNNCRTNKKSPQSNYPTKPHNICEVCSSEYSLAGHTSLPWVTKIKPVEGPFSYFYQ